MKINQFKIEVDRNLLRYCVPQSVWRQPPFKLPDPDGQIEYNVRRWYVRKAKVFALTAADELRVEYGAAFLVMASLLSDPHHEIWWMRIEDQKLTRYTGQFKDPKPWPKNEADPTIVVHTQLGPTLTAVQTESVRDLIARWPQAQHLVCGHGTEPVDLAHALMIPIYGQLSLRNTVEITSV